MNGLARARVTEDADSFGEGTLARAPASSVATPLGEHEPQPVVIPAGLRVLAAEDNAVNRLVLKALFDVLGIEPTLVSNGQEAVSAWRAGEFDVVLMDIQMPVMDGVSAADLIRRTEITEGRRRTPIIAVTTNVMEHQKADYLAVGMDAMVAKPIVFATLLETIDAVLASDDAVARRSVG
jgi:two-component system, sensor histidine kinase